MKIAVCVKQVPESQAKRIDAGTKRLDRSGEATLNSFDANAIEEALRLRDATGEGEVVLVSLGPEKALDALRKGLAMGADRAVLVSDDAAAGSDLVATSLRDAEVRPPAVQLLELLFVLRQAEEVVLLLEPLDVLGVRRVDRAPSVDELVLVLESLAAQAVEALVGGEVDVVVLHPPPDERHRNLFPRQHV